MEDTCCVLRPDLVLKIDRRQNTRPDLVPLLENMAVALTLVDKANHVFLETPFFIRSVGETGGNYNIFHLHAHYVEHVFY